MDEFQGKDEQFVAEWLKREGFKPPVVDAFLEDEVDGDAFLELTEEMLQSLIPKSGPRAKFIKKRKDLLASSLPKVPPPTESPEVVASSQPTTQPTSTKGAPLETEPPPLPVQDGASQMVPSHEEVAKPRLAERVKAMCGNPIENGPPVVYKLPLKSVMRDAEKGIAKSHIGDPDPTDKSPEKVIMVLGATGAGKSTLINGIVNYVLGVQWDDDFRFKLIADEADTAGATQAFSQTSWITAYTFHKMEDSPVPNKLTIIDTPGFGDTRGLKRDKKITSQIKEFFSIPNKDGGIDHLDGIGFVTQASLARLTPTQKYIFDSILATFGKDIASNIFMMVTFADGNKPPVLDAIHAGNIPFKKYFKFNNSALFTKCDQKNEQGGEQGGEDDEEEEFAQMFWKMGTKSFRTFFTSFAKVDPISLQMTKEVLAERHKLETNIEGLQKKVKNGLSHIDVLQQEERVLRKMQAEIDANKNCTYKVKVPKTRKIDLKGSSTFVTNCLQCNFSCHYPCGIADDSQKYNCAAIDYGGVSDAKCTVCPGRCHWTKHVNRPYRFEDYEEEEERTIDDLKKRYEEAIEGKTTAEGMIQNMESHLQFMYDKVLEMIGTIKQSLSRLDEIALKPNPLTEVQYIELLIQSEKDQAKSGWEQRVEYYKEMKQQALLLQAATNPEQVIQLKQKKPAKSLWERLKFW